MPRRYEAALPASTEILLTGPCNAIAPPHRHTKSAACAEVTNAVLPIDMSKSSQFLYTQTPNPSGQADGEGRPVHRCNFPPRQNLKKFSTFGDRRWGIPEVLKLSRVRIEVIKLTPFYPVEQCQAPVSLDH